MGTCKSAECKTEVERLRAALTKIANDSYTREDERLTSEQPMMIWQLVARAALTSAKGAPPECCPICGGDCAGANPPVTYCPMRTSPTPQRGAT